MLPCTRRQLSEKAGICVLFLFNAMDRIIKSEALYDKSLAGNPAIFHSNRQKNARIFPGAMFT